MDGPEDRGGVADDEQDGPVGWSVGAGPDRSVTSGEAARWADLPTGAASVPEPLSTPVRVLRFAGCVAMLALGTAACLGLLGLAFAWWYRTLP